jgi:hypothetical protein
MLLSGSLQMLGTFSPMGSARDPLDIRNTHRGATMSWREFLIAAVVGIVLLGGLGLFGILFAVASAEAVTGIPDEDE